MPKRKFKQRRRRTGRKNLRAIVQKVIEGNLESRMLNTQLSSIGVSTTGTSTYLTPVDQGDTQNSRQGNQIRLTGMHGKMILTAGDSTNVVRTILYIPKVSSSSISGVGVNDFVDLDQYTVLQDRLHTLSTSGSSQVKSFTISKKFNKGARKGILVQFSGPTGSSQTVKNAMKLYYVSDSGAAVHPTLDANIRVYFKDG